MSVYLVFELVKLKLNFIRVHLRLSQRPQIRPCHRIQIVRPQHLTIIHDQLRHKIENFKHYHHIFLKNVVDRLVDDEFFIPFTEIVARDTQIEHSCAEWKEEVDLSILWHLLVNFIFVVVLHSEKIAALKICDAWHLFVRLSEILIRIQINNVHPHKWMEHILVHFEDAGAAYYEAEGQLLSIIKWSVHIIPREILIYRVHKSLLPSNFVCCCPWFLTASCARQKHLPHDIPIFKPRLDSFIVEVYFEFLVDPIKPTLMLRLNLDPLLAHGAPSHHAQVLRHIQLFVVVQIVRYGVVVVVHYCAPNFKLFKFKLFEYFIEFNINYCKIM